MQHDVTKKYETTLMSLFYQDIQYLMSDFFQSIIYTLKNMKCFVIITENRLAK